MEETLLEVMGPEERESAAARRYSCRSRAPGDASATPYTSSIEGKSSSKLTSPPPPPPPRLGRAVSTSTSASSSSSVSLEPSESSSVVVEEEVELPATLGFLVARLVLLLDISSRFLPSLVRGEKGEKSVVKLGM